MTRDRESIEGYHAPIHRAVWERILRLGVPRVWATVWLVICAYTALLFGTVLGLTWVLAPLIGWVVGHGVLVLLTQSDAQWDDLALAHLTRRYRGFYDA